MALRIDPQTSSLSSASPSRAERRSPSRPHSPQYTLLTDANVLPGTTNALMGPLIAATTARTLYKARASGDREIKIDGGLRMIQTPFNLAGAAGSSVTTAFNLGKLLDLFSVGANLVNTATKVSVIAGFIICGIEAIYESIGLKRALVFLCKINGIKTPRHFFEWLFNLKNKTYLKTALNTKIENFAVLHGQTPDQAIARLEARSIELNHAYQRLSSDAQAKIGPIPQLEHDNHVQNNSQLDSFEDAINNETLLSLLQSIDRRYLSLSERKLEEIDRKALEKFSFPARSFSKMDVLDRASELLPKDTFRDVARASANVFDLKINAQEAYRDFLIQEKIQGKRNNLADRVRIWKAQEVVEQLPQVLRQLKSENPEEQIAGRAAATQLLDDLNTQGKKKSLGHSISLTSIVFTIVGLSLTIACPYAAIALMTIGMIIGFARYFFNNGVSDTRGWGFNASNCVPDMIKDLWNWMLSESRPTTTPWASPIYPVPMLS